MNSYEQLLLINKAWSKEMTESDPMFFQRLAKTQKPNFLWIGCSDSRVSPTEITQSKPGEIFIHRNVANLVVHTDLNVLSVVQYAVEVLEIEHIIVCGHYGCGGVKAALQPKSYGLIDEWLRHIKDVYQRYQKEIDQLETEEQRVNRLVECNIKEQLLNLAKTAMIQKSWKNNKRPYLHGWVYSLEDGIVNPLLELAPNSSLSSPYQYDNL